MTQVLKVGPLIPQGSHIPEFQGWAVEMTGGTESVFFVASHPRELKLGGGDRQCPQVSPQQNW